MTRRETLRKIKQMGITARYDTVWQEFILDSPKGHSLRTNDSSYHTTSQDDAYETACYMVKIGETK